MYVKEIRDDEMKKKPYLSFSLHTRLVLGDRCALGLPQVSAKGRTKCYPQLPTTVFVAFRLRLTVVTFHEYIIFFPTYCNITWCIL